MPYITSEKKMNIDAGVGPSTVGELNYLITEACINWIRWAGISYASINEVIGVLECAKQEFYRRVAVPYEDKKIKENGDVY